MPDRDRGRSTRTWRGDLGRCLALTTLAGAAFLASPSEAHAQGWSRLVVRAEGGVGAMLSDYQRNQDPGRFGGNTPGYGMAVQGTLRVSVRLWDAFSLQLSAGNWLFPDHGGGVGWAFTPMGGFRVEPRVGRAGRFFFDGDLGAAFTGSLVRWQFDVGVGFEFDVTRALAMGPVVRYGQTVQPDETHGQPEMYPDDARYVTVGISIALRPPPPVATASMDMHDDRDGDRVDDLHDHCVGAPQGLAQNREHPGCPVPDLDLDGVTDDEDRCIDVASGTRPDADRPGCPAPPITVPPLIDTDHDGFVDARDRCPDRAEVFNGVNDDDGCPEPRSHALVEIQEGVIEMFGAPVLFPSGSDRIVGRSGFTTLDALVGILRAHQEIELIEVQGHTDARGGRWRNVQLSRRRAAAVRQYLIDHGVSPSRVEARGLGAERPMGDNRSPHGQANNRRVEIHIMRFGARAPSDHAAR